jgi:hypothetical protein
MCEAGGVVAEMVEKRGWRDLRPMHVWLFLEPDGFRLDHPCHREPRSGVAIHRAYMRAAAWIASSLRFSQ